MRIARLIFILVAVTLACGVLGGSVGGLVAFAVPATIVAVLDVDLGPGTPATSGRNALSATHPADPVALAPESAFGVPRNVLTRGAAIGAAAGLLLGTLLGFVVALVDQVMLFSRSAMSAISMTNAGTRRGPSSFTPPPSVEI
ncbi:MAG: hypothetical protein NTW19_09700 [Planctomycetota bacterium]|nr:hypothetical protein [Planctomycetota bacterium]